MDIGRLAGNVFGLVKQAAVDLLEKKDTSGKPVVLDVLPDLMEAGRDVLNLPQLPPVDHELAMAGLQDLVALLTANNDQARFDAAKGLAAKLVPGVAQALAAEVGKAASDNFVADVAQGILKWVSQNPTQALQLGVEIARVAATAVATGGTSLAVDLPALLPKVTAMAVGVLQASGIEVDKLLKGMVTDMLKFVGVQDATAEKIGAVMGPLLALGGDIAMAIATNGKHPINPNLLRSAVSAVAEASGMPPNEAAIIATAACMAATLGQNLAGQMLAGKPLTELFPNLDKMGLKLADVGIEAVKLYFGQQGASLETIAAKLKDLGPLFQAFSQDLYRNATELNVSNSAKAWEAVNQHFLTMVPGWSLFVEAVNVHPAA